MWVKYRINTVSTSLRPDGLSASGALFISASALPSHTVNTSLPIPLITFTTKKKNHFWFWIPTLGVSTLFRTSPSGQPVYVDPIILSPPFYLLLTSSFILNIIWIFVWNNEMIVAGSIFLLLITYSAWLAVGYAVLRLVANCTDRCRSQYTKGIISNTMGYLSTHKDFILFLQFLEVMRRYRGFY